MAEWGQHSASANQSPKCRDMWPNMCAQTPPRTRSSAEHNILPELKRAMDTNNSWVGGGIGRALGTAVSGVMGRVIRRGMGAGIARVLVEMGVAS